jgi:hypothetical protein
LAYARAEKIMSNPAGTTLPVGGFDPVADVARKQGWLANTSSFANSGMGVSTNQAVAGAGVNLNAADVAFQDALNNALTNIQTTSNKFGGSNGGTQQAGTGGFPSGFNQQPGSTDTSTG